MARLERPSRKPSAAPLARNQPRRSQANTAKLPTDNSTLTLLRELKILGIDTARLKLNIVLGDKGLKDRVMDVL
jgi:hypothetical protein